jgi:HSP20 family protein
LVSRDREGAEVKMTKRTQTWPALPWQPSADIHRTRDGWLLKLDLAGVQIEDVTISIRGRRVVVSGVRRDSFLEEGSSYYSMEISYNRFERSVEMPANLETARVIVAARDGLLLVRMITEGNQNV